MRQEKSVAQEQICFRVCGIPVIISVWAAVGFIFLVWFIIGLSIKRLFLSNAEHVLIGLSVAVAVYIGAIFHEAAHAVAVVFIGEKVNWFQLSWWGAQIHASPEHLRELRPQEEMLVAVVGPLANFVVAGVTAIPLLAIDNYFVRSLLLFSTYANLFFGICNLLPIYKADGYWIVEGLTRAVFGETSVLADSLKHLFAVAGIVTLYFIGQFVFFS
ncbi:MAG: hypothetical protein AAB897_01390 [Patescibacteria group bacterium]